MTSVGDVIQPGQPIPDDVTECVDVEHDTWILTGRGHWHFTSNVKLCDKGLCGNGNGDPAGFAPLTVTAVREQPAEPARHAFVQGGADSKRCKRVFGAMFCGFGPSDFPHQCTQCGQSFTGRACGPTHALMATGQLDEIVADATPREQPAEPARKLIGPPHAHRDAPCTDACYEPAEPRFELLTLPPGRGLVLAACGHWWRETRPPGTKVRSGQPRVCASCPPGVPNAPGRSEQGLALVQVEYVEETAPEPQQADAGIKRDLHEPHVDGPREPSAQERADHDLMAALGVEQLDEVMPAIEHLKALVDHLRNWRSEHDKRERERDEARAEVERLKADVKVFTDVFGAKPDLMVLSLPEVPEGTEALVDRHERRWTPSGMVNATSDGGGVLHLWESGSGALRNYAALLAGSGPLRVELAAARAAADQADTVHADGSHTYWSTHCRHGSHEACSATSMVRNRAARGPAEAAPRPVEVLKAAAQCKTCAAPCICPCHEQSRVELAPPREPRTWPKLDPVPDDLRHVRGASGTVYARSSGTFAFNGYRNGQSVTRSLHALQEEDGPLIEVTG